KPRRATSFASWTIRPALGSTLYAGLLNSGQLHPIFGGQPRRRALAGALPRVSRPGGGCFFALQLGRCGFREALYCRPRGHPLPPNADCVQADPVPVGARYTLEYPAKNRGEVCSTDLSDFLDSQEFFVGDLNHGTRSRVLAVQITTIYYSSAHRRKTRKD